MLLHASIQLITSMHYLWLTDEEKSKSFDEVPQVEDSTIWEQVMDVDFSGDVDSSKSAYGYIYTIDIFTSNALKMYFLHSLCSLLLYILEVININL